MNKLYSLLEQHYDGSWWYHPGDTFNSSEEVEKCFKRKFWYDLDRPHKVIEHYEPLFQEYSSCTFDFKTFDFVGNVVCVLKDSNIK